MQRIRAMKLKKEREVVAKKHKDFGMESIARKSAIFAFRTVAVGAMLGYGVYADQQDM